MRKKKRIWVGMIFFLAIICIIPVLSVQGATKIADKKVRVACGINKSLYLDESGKPAGYCSEYLGDLAQINHWDLEYVEGSWTDSVKRLMTGDIDLLLPTQKTKERQKIMGFSAAIGGYQPIGLYAKKESNYCYDGYEQFQGAKVALSKGTSNEAVLKAYAKEHDFTFTTVDMNTTEEKMQALQDGTVDLIVFSTLNDVPDGKVVAMLDYLPFYYCTNIKNQELLKELNYGMNQMILRHADVVQDVFYSFMNKNISFAYTAQEQQEISTHGKVTIGVYEDTPPLFDVDSQGNYVGIYVDIIERIKKISGLDIEIKPLDRKSHAFEYLDQGNLDFVMGSSDQALQYSSEKGYVQSEGVMDYYSIMITQSNYTMEADKDMVFALTSGRQYWEPILKQKYPKATIAFYKTSKECLDAVQKRDADVTILNSWEYNYQSKNQRYEELMEWENSRTLSETVFISLENQNELIRSVMDKSIEQIANSEKEQIITANLNRSYDSFDIWDNLYKMKDTIMIFGFIFLIVVVAILVYGVMRRRSVHILEDKNRQLENANTAKDSFLSRMSHELRTPLNAINGYATVLGQNMDSDSFNEEQAKDSVESILRAAKYQLAIIGDLLDIQKIETGKMELHPTEVESISYMENIIQMIRPEADAKGVTFTYERLSNMSESYELDGVRFQQVLLNILHNAIKFTNPGGKVMLTAEVIDQDEKTNTLKFVISDNGIGMSEEFQEQYLFHRFAQEYKGNTSPYEGCGTGLAISKEIIHLMGGEITCKSVQGVGSTFTIILVAKHTDRKRKRRQRKQYPTYDLHGTRVLLCEDNPINQDMEKRLLERMNCQVDIADDGEAGVTRFEQSEPGYYDIVLMDIRMPKMDGLEATRRIRDLQREDTSQVPIVAVSANAFEEDVAQSLAAGMNEHLAKPVDAKILYEKIMQYCEVK